MSNCKDDCMPRITVIVAVYNGAKTLQRCLDSFACQTYPNKELVVIDGGSSDGTVEILEMNSDCIFYYESVPDRGIAHAWNKGVDRSTGSWLIFLGADDYLWSPQSLHEIAAHLNETSNFDVVYGDVVGVTKNGDRIGLLSSKWNRKKFTRYGIYFSHQGIFHRRSLFNVYGGFDEEFRYSPDYEFLLRYLVDHDAMYCQNVTVSAMQMGGVSNSPANAFVALSDFSKARRKLNIEGDSPLYYRARLGAFVKLTLEKVSRLWR